MINDQRQVFVDAIQVFAGIAALLQNLSQALGHITGNVQLFPNSELLISPFKPFYFVGHDYLVLPLFNRASRY